MTLRSLLFHGLSMASVPLWAQPVIQAELNWRSASGTSTVDANARLEGRDPASRPAPTYPDMPFAGAFLDMSRGGLPYWQGSVELPWGAVGFSAHLSDVRFEQVPPEDLARWPELVRWGGDVEVRTALSWLRKRPVGLVSVVPFRRDPATGQVQRLVGFRLDIVEERGTGGGGRPKSYPEHSKLAVGDWYRFTVVRDGVHQLTYEFLRDLGVAVEGLASDRINVYGSHFGQLPMSNAFMPPTDLLPNAVLVEDGGDGTLNPGDRILFYASGPNNWKVDGDRFVHAKNVFTDSASYFIGIDADPPKRIQAALLSSDPPTATVTSFSERQFIERDLVNLIKSGRTWFGETFDLVTTHNYNFDTPFLVPGEAVTLCLNGAARTPYSGTTANASSFTVTSNGLNNTFSVPGVYNSYTGMYARPFNQCFSFTPPAGNSIPLTVTFNKFDPVSSVGWMNYAQLNCRRQLRFVGDQLMFRDLPSVGPGQVVEYVLDQAQNVHRIWDITDPLNVRWVSATDNGTEKRFRMAADSLREFIAFRNGGYLTPTKVGRVANQDLHATALGTELVIVCPPQFMVQAQRLAEQRAQEGLSVAVVTLQQVFNEFSSGARDATAIKRFMRMLYDRAGTNEELMPRYLLLFGDGSYNNISLVESNQNWIPSYQTANSWDYSFSYTTDDYYSMLDPGEGENTSDLPDIGVGRLPVATEQQARELVDKILGYDRLRLLGSDGGVCTETGDGGIADWRTHVLFVSDDQDGGGFEGQIHMSHTDFLARRVEEEQPCFNVDKLLLDAYQQTSTPGGQRYPQATQQLRERVQKGLLLVNYIGHGGEVGWGHERILDNSTILGWSNRDRLPIFMTATCEFSRWDDPGRTSAGEYVVLNPNGGGIALMTTTRLAYSNQNFQLGQRFYDHVFRTTDHLGREFRFGDIFRETKRAIATSNPNDHNHRNFSLLGDPSQRLAMPRLSATIATITDTLGNPIDTLKALTTVRIAGFIDDGTGQPLTTFNGLVVPTVYDKQLQQATLANDGGLPFTFKVRKNILYRGRASVTNGSFSFTFVVPKDINYDVGPGRVSCYAESYETNACGWTNEPLVGATATEIAFDDRGPEIRLYMNDERFVRGGLTDQSPLLLAKLFDDNGINTVGSSIGHDLLAVLDGNTEQAIVLNDQYEADLDTYKSGTVRQRLSGLAEGPHTVRVKAWDTHNNSAEATTEFVVAASAELALAHVLNYPNPFTTRTEFFFEHNKPCTSLDVQVQVFTVSGRLVKTLNRQVACEGYRIEGLPWDGRDDNGDKLARGVYVYRLNVSTAEGERAEKFEKLVILR